MAEGKLRVSLSMTEPDGGTDVLGAMKTMAKKVDGGWVLNGAKMWTTAAKVADRLLVLARTDKNVEKKHQGLTLFFVDAKSHGITARSEEHTSELQSLMRISYAVFCLKQNKLS